MEQVNFEDLSKEEKIDFLRDSVGQDDMESEICYLISIFTTVKIKNETCEKYNLTELCTDELIEHINLKLIASETNEEELSIWNLIIETIGHTMVLDLIFKVGEFMKELNEIIIPLESVKRKMIELFVLKDR